MGLQTRFKSIGLRICSSRTLLPPPQMATSGTAAMGGVAAPLQVARSGHWAAPVPVSGHILHTKHQQALTAPGLSTEHGEADSSTKPKM